MAEGAGGSVSVIHGGISGLDIPPTPLKDTGNVKKMLAWWAGYLLLLSSVVWMPAVIMPIIGNGPETMVSRPATQEPAPRGSEELPAPATHRSITEKPASRTVVAKDRASVPPPVAVGETRPVRPLKAAAPTSTVSSASEVKEPERSAPEQIEATAVIPKETMSNLDEAFPPARSDTEIAAFAGENAASSKPEMPKQLEPEKIDIVPENVEAKPRKSASLSVGPTVRQAVPAPTVFAAQEGSVEVRNTAVLEMTVSGTVTEVRLFGIEGVEGDSAQEFQEFVNAYGEVRCGAVGSGTYSCSIDAEGERVDLAAAALRNGAARTALDAPDSYRRFEREAKAEKRGIWNQ